MTKSFASKSLAVSCFALSFAILPVRAAFNITITGLEGTVYRSYFDQAAAFWEAAITGYADASLEARINTLTITANMADLGQVDEHGMITLGHAGPSDYLVGQNNDFSYYVVTTEGEMEFNSSYAPYSEESVATFSQSFYDVVRHEMGHVFGIGTLWSVPLVSGNNVVGYANELRASSDPTSSGYLQYIGEHALANYRAEFNQPSATYVPLENDGGPGTKGGHWDEVYGGAFDTGLVSNITGEDMRYELMTGWADSPTFLSSVTLGALEDLGYIVDYSILAAVPEPAAVALFLGGGMLAFTWFRRRL